MATSMSGTCNININDHDALAEYGACNVNGIWDVGFLIIRK
jgi:hypothetical protein